MLSILIIYLVDFWCGAMFFTSVLDVPLSLIHVYFIAVIIRIVVYAGFIKNLSSIICDVVCAGFIKNIFYFRWCRFKKMIQLLRIIINMQWLQMFTLNTSINTHTAIYSSKLIHYHKELNLIMNIAETNGYSKD